MAEVMAKKYMIVYHVSAGCCGADELNDSTDYGWMCREHSGWREAGNFTDKAKAEKYARNYEDGYVEEME